MTKPANKELYERIKKQLYKEMPQHSAYRSGLLVQRYKEAGGTYEGTKPKKKGLARWFAEEWKNQRGGEGYKMKGDVYRPTKRITDKTPVTFSELTKSQIARAQKAKIEKGRAVFK